MTIDTKRFWERAKKTGQGVGVMSNHPIDAKAVLEKWRRGVVENYCPECHVRSGGIAHAASCSRRIIIRERVGDLSNMGPELAGALAQEIAAREEAERKLAAALDLKLAERNAQWIVTLEDRLARAYELIHTAITSEDGLDGDTGGEFLRECGFWPRIEEEASHDH